MPRLRVLCLITLATVLPIAPTIAQQPISGAPQTKGKKFAVLVGVNEYTNRKLDPLKYAEADVTDLAEVLKAAGFQVQLLRGSATGKDEAIRANIEAALTETFNEVGRHDTLLLAFSGHGQQLFLKAGASDEKNMQKEVPFYCPKDAIPADAATLISLSGVLKRLDEKGGKTNLLLVDACRNVVDPNRGARGGVDGNRVENLGEGTAVFFACTGRQRAMETDKAGGGHGVFFHFVLEGLKGAPGTMNGNGQVTWDRLVPFVKERVTQHTPVWFSALPEAERQRPHAIGNLATDPVLTTPSVDGVVAADYRAVELIVKVGNGADNFYEVHAPSRLAVWKQASATGVPAGMFLYGRCLHSGTCVEKDEAQAVVLYQKAAMAEITLAMINLGICYENGIGVEKDYRQTVIWYRKAAVAGNGLAMFRLGRCYENGLGVEKDTVQAVAWYRKAANAGNGLAMTRLGGCYEDGTGVEKDEAQAVLWYRRAAEVGNALGMACLGTCFVTGRGTKKDFPEAVTWLQKAAALNDGLGMNNLGWCYMNGWGVIKDEEQAVLWYRKSAATGYALAMRNLGDCYEYGRGVKKNFEQAVAWYRKGSDGGNASAMHGLARCYEKGYGVEINAHKSFEWHKKAADYGDNWALWCLGDCYMYGRGIERNVQQAVILFRKSYRQAVISGDRDLANQSRTSLANLGESP